MAEVVSLLDRRLPPQDGYDGLRRECGGAWFRLGAGSPEDFEHGAVCINADGSVTGYSGTPHCASCGRECLP